VFFGDLGGNFYALGAATGQKLWGQKIGGAIGGGVIAYNAAAPRKSPSRPALPTLAFRRMSQPAKSSSWASNRDGLGRSADPASFTSPASDKNYRQLLSENRKRRYDRSRHGIRDRQLIRKQARASFGSRAAL
jgi:hypothetical protein